MTPLTDALQEINALSLTGADGSAQPEHQDAQWPAGIWAKWSLEKHALPDADNTPELRAELFEAFRCSRGAEGIAASFARLYAAAYNHQRQTSSEAILDSMQPLDVIRKAVGEQRRLAKVLWERLDARRNAADYCSRPLRGHRVVVVGAGPAGLRCALELRLLGADVVVLEKRKDFERINRLHLWNWCGQDLKGWGAKVLEPPELSFGSNADFLHIGIGELQMLLLKPCLLLGVQVFFGTEFVRTEQHVSSTGDSQTAVWDVVVGVDAACNGSKYPSVPAHLQGVSSLVVAEGPGGVVAQRLGLEKHEAASLRKEAAIGLVANYTNRQCADEKGRRSFSLARQFYEAKFKQCEKQTGMALENVVCYISQQTHYFVMTPTKRSLIDLGIVSDSSSGNLLSTLNKAALTEAVRAVAAFPWKPEDKPLQKETLDRPVGPPVLFDFSRQKRAAAGVRFMEGPAVAGCEPARLLVGICGDGLIAPFWPEGLGIIRGFFGALDLASAIKVWADTSDAHAASCHFEASFRCLKSLAAKTREQVLKSDESAYGLDPATRYRGLSTAEGKQHRSRSVPCWSGGGGERPMSTWPQCPPKAGI